MGLIDDVAGQFEGLAAQAARLTDELDALAGQALRLADEAGHLGGSGAPDFTAGFSSAASSARGAAGMIEPLPALIGGYVGHLVGGSSGGGGFGGAVRGAVMVAKALGPVALKSGGLLMSINDVIPIDGPLGDILDSLPARVTDAAVDVVDLSRHLMHGRTSIKTKGRYHR